MKKLTILLLLATSSFLGYSQDSIQAIFSMVDACNGTEVVFTNTSKVPVKFGNANYTWTFGDGGTSTAQFPKHTFNLSNPDAGQSFEVKLVVQSKSIPSEKDSMVDFIQIFPNPNAYFRWDVINKGNTQDVVIDSQGTKSASNFYQWNLAGVLKSNDITPTFLHAQVEPYLDGKDHSFSLLVRTPESCETTYTTTFNYNPLSAPTVSVERFIAYPNPTNGNLHLKQPLSKVKIQTLQGVTVFENEASISTLKLDVPAGIYMLSGDLNGLNVNQRIVVQ